MAWGALKYLLTRSFLVNKYVNEELTQEIMSLSLAELEEGELRDSALACQQQECKKLILRVILSVVDGITSERLSSTLMRCICSCSSSTLQTIVQTSKGRGNQSSNVHELGLLAFGVLQQAISKVPRDNCPVDILEGAVSTCLWTLRQEEIYEELVPVANESC